MTCYLKEIYISKRCRKKLELNLLFFFVIYVKKIWKVYLHIFFTRFCRKKSERIRTEGRHWITKWNKNRNRNRNQNQNRKWNRNWNWNRNLNRNQNQNRNLNLNRNQNWNRNRNTKSTKKRKNTKGSLNWFIFKEKWKISSPCISRI